MNTETFDISCYWGGGDRALFQSVINQGIDARLEAFTESKFKFDPVSGRLELETEEADRWVSDIILAEYGKEIRE